MNTGAKVPAPSAEERSLQKQQAELLKFQTDILKQQQAQQKILIPFLAEQEGFNVELDEAGNLKSISRQPDELRDKQKQLESELADRSLAALRGELPVSPALERDLSKQNETLRERLSRQLGPGFETSSAGIEALQGQEESAEALREGARTAQLTLAEQLGITRQQQNEFSAQSSRDALRQGTQGDPLALAGAFGQTASGFGQAQAPFIQNRQMQFQANANRSSGFAGMVGAGVGALGSIFASPAGSAFLFSDERLKSGAVPIADHPAGFPIYLYEMDGEQFIGAFAGDVEAVIPAAVAAGLGGYKMVNYKAL